MGTRGGQATAGVGGLLDRVGVPHRGKLGGTRVGSNLRDPLTGPGTDALGLTDLCPSKALHPHVIVPARGQAIQQHLRPPTRTCRDTHAGPTLPAPFPQPPFPMLLPPCPPRLSSVPRTSLLSSSPLGEAGDHRTRYWVASAEGCQVRRTVLGVTAARVSAWGGGRGAGGDGSRKFKNAAAGRNQTYQPAGVGGGQTPVSPLVGAG